MKSNKIILGLLAGVALGAIAGILLAPEKGSDTRNNISKKSNGYADKLKTLFNDFVEGFTAKFDAMHEDAEKMTEQVKTKAEHMTENVRTKAESVAADVAEYKRR
jgi:gas vesicle protein